MQHKMTEALSAVVPIIVLVLLLCFTVAPMSPSILLSFLMGAVLVMVGMMFFTLGAETSVTPMGEKVGAKMAQSKRVWLIVLLSFVLGIIITISEPDLQVLAQLVPSIPNRTLILAVLILGLIFIVVRTDQKNAIMQSIMQEAETGTKAGAIVFSLPVTDTAGMRLIEQIDEDE